MSQRRLATTHVALVLLVSLGAASSGCVRTVGTRPGVGDGGVDPPEAAVGEDSTVDGDSSSAPVEAGLPIDGAAPCPSQCSSCSANECTISCNSALCPAKVCPKGMRCVFRCTGDFSCSQPLDCGESTHCNVFCNGLGSCTGLIRCGGGDCEVRCSGPTSCTGTIEATPLTQGMAVHCSGNSACSANILCGSGKCEVECSGDLTCSGDLDCSKSCGCKQSCGKIGVCSGSLTCIPGCSSCRTALGCGSC
ncbi:MAG: hypothetical protein KC503_45810 [Myxococcales bacterium]|nr:hypothetical protein [Myxococcales bacterium]